MTTQADSIGSLVFPFPTTLSEHGQDAAEACERIERSILHLVHYGQMLCKNGEYDMTSLCHEVRRLSDEQLCLLLHTPGTPFVKTFPNETQVSLPVSFAQRTYGMLCLLHEPFEGTSWTFSLAQVRLLAQICGWLLYILEQTAFLQGQCQQLNYQIHGALTSRELEVLALMCRGYDGKAIADRLCISVTTVGKHRQHIYEQLGVHNERDACLVAYQVGLYAAFISQKAE